MEWRPIAGFEGVYSVSDCGRVRTENRTIAYGVPLQTRRIKQRELTTSFNGRYLTVGLSLSGRTTTHNVHELVLRAFVGAPPNGYVARHLNGNGRDNRLANLQWGTRHENQLDRYRHGTARHGDTHFRNILTESQVRQILLLEGKHDFHTIASLVGCKHHNVASVIYGVAWNWLSGKPRRNSTINFQEIKESLNGTI